MGIRVAGVSKQFGAFRAVDDVSLDVETARWWPCSGLPAQAKAPCSA